MRFQNRTFLFTTLLLLGTSSSPLCIATEIKTGRDEKVTESVEKLFTLKVMPVLKEKCGGCHGDNPDDLKGGLSVLSRESLLTGGETGEPSIEIGKPRDSYLVSAIKWEDSEMPPKESDRLTPDQIEAIEKWIEFGAPWPSLERQKAIRQEAANRWENEEGTLVATSGGQSEQWTNRRYQKEDLWAFLPLKPMSSIEPLEIRGHQLIDALINKKLSDLELTPSAEASPRELIRRATYDLTGLPPKYEQIVEFEKRYAKDKDAAWHQLLETLLASPRYGEHWGRHWLDVTRYSDTGGMSNDYERSNLWRYRDYVIRSFNSDKPYDDFIREQIAGDEMADHSLRKRLKIDTKQLHQMQEQGEYNQEESEWIIATGFLRLGPWDNAMIENDEARQIYLDDLVNITGQTFLSQTLRCVKCHDHKFDPIPTRDYYSIYSAFGTTQMAERPVPFLESENKSRFEEGEAHVQTMLAYARTEKDKIIDVQETAAKQWYEEHQLPYKTENERRSDPDEMKPPRHVGLNFIQQGQRKVREQDEWIWNRRLERYQPMAQSVYNAESNLLAWNGARMLRINRKKQKGTTTTSNILVGGNLNAIGEKVTPGVLSALGLTSSEDLDSPFSLPANTDGRRLALANWIADERNQLTSRSIVNRVWQFHFGKGIAANPNNFGAKGSKPTHPELLDYLAQHFIENEWSIKNLHRLIMQSDSYRRSTQPADSQQQSEIDPNNEYLASFPRRRLLSEEIRDSILQASGELKHELGGLPCMPEINMEVALQPRMIQFSIAPAYQPSPLPAVRNRRSVYAYQVRGQADPFAELFNQPNPNESCELRESAAVTPQAFALLNSEMINDRSIAVANRIANQKKVSSNEGEPPITAESVQDAFRFILQREASQEETERLLSYAEKMTSYHESNPAGKTTYPTRITRSLVEEFTGRPFEYEEILPVFESYQPDIKAHEVSPSIRALADICLLLFNTNEFIYVE